MKRPLGPAIAVTMFLAAIALPVVYGLSAGPALMLVTRGVIRMRTYEAFYFPLNWTAGKVPPLEAFLSWYCAFFLPEPSLPFFG